MQKNEKYLILPYETQNQKELTIRFKHEHVDLEIPDESIIFNKFNVPDEYEYFFKDFKSYCIFYLDISKFEYYKKECYIEQECIRPINSKAHYFSNNLYLTNDDDEFLFDMQFKNNHEYFIYKQPNGSSIKKKINEITINLIFLLSEKIVKNRFKMCNYFLADFEKKKFKEFAFKDDNINNYLKYISELFKQQQRIKVKSSINNDDFICLLCIFLGLIPNEKFGNSRRENLERSIIESIINVMKQDETTLNFRNIPDLNLIEKYFSNGLQYIFYCCLSNQSIDLLTFFISNSMSFMNSAADIVLGKKFEKESFVTNKQLIQSQIKNLVESKNKFKYFTVLLKLCADLKDFLTLNELIVENNLDIKKFLNYHKDFISNEILLKASKQQIIDSNELIIQYKGIQANLTEFNSKIMVHFILNVKDFEKAIGFFEEIIDADLEENVWIIIIDYYLMKPLDLNQYMKLFEKIHNLKIKNELKFKIRDKIRELILSKIREIRAMLSFNHNEIKQIKYCLNSKLVYPYGCISILKDNLENILKKEKDNDLIKFLIIEIFFEQFDRCDKDIWKSSVLNFFNLMSFNLNEDCLRKIMDIINKTSDIDLDFSKDLFQKFLNKLNSIDQSQFKTSILKVIIFIVNNKYFEEIYINFFQVQIFEPLKFKKEHDLKIYIKEFLLNLENIRFDTQIKEKLILKLLSNQNKIDSLKDELFKNPNRNNLSYKILVYSSGMSNLSNIHFVKSLKENATNQINSLINGTLFFKDVRLLHDYNEDELKIFCEIIHLSNIQKSTILQIKNNVKNSIKEIYSTIDDLNNLKQCIEFLMKSDNKEYKPVLDSLNKLLNSINDTQIKDIKIPDNCLAFKEFSYFYEKFKKSSSFVCIFKQAYDDLTAKKKDDEESIDINGLLNSIEFSFKQLVNTLNDKNMLEGIYLEKYFINLKDKNEINEEIKLINEKYRVNDEDFIKLCIFNIINCNYLANLFQNLENSLKSFQLNSNDLMENYLKFISNEKKFKMIEFNKLVEEINRNFKFIIELSQDSEIIQVMNEMGKSKKLIEFLLDKNEQDLRNLIDSLDEHGDGYIRVQNIIELCRVTQFFQSLNRNGTNLEFIKSIIEILNNDKEKKYSNLSANIYTSFSILDNIRLILDTFQNREEASKLKIIELATNSEFCIQFENKSFSVITMFRGKKPLSLNDLYDLRDRALLMTNNQMNSAENFQNISRENIEESKRLYENFTKSVELLNNIVSYLNQSYTSGYPIEKLHKNIFLKIKEKNYSEIENFEKEISAECHKWQNDLIDLQKKYNILNYFWGRHFILLEGLLVTKDDMNKLREHLYFINSNIMTLRDEMFPPFQITLSATPIEKVELLAKYLTDLFEKVKPQNRIEINKNNIQNDEQIILIKTDHYRYYLNAMILCYRDNDMFFPIANQVLFCNSSTSWQELRSFLFRIVNNEQNKCMHTLIGPEQLDFENQVLFLENFHKLAKNSKNRFIKLALISFDNNCHIYNILNQNYILGIRVEKYQNNKEILKFNVVQNLIQKWQTYQTVITSKYSGLGKSTYVRNNSRNSILITHSISNSENFQVLAENMKNCQGLNNQSSRIVLHFDIFNSNNDESLNEFLFMLIFFRIVKVKDYTINFYNIEHFYFEIANTFQDNLLDRFYVGLLCNRIHIEEFKINSLDLDLLQLEKCENESVNCNPLQIVCNYLNFLDRNQINANDLNCEKIQLLDASTCANLLSKYFVKLLEPILQISFTQLCNFINLLSYYLHKFGKNPFNLVDSIKFYTEMLPNGNQKNNLLELREKMVRTLIDLACKIAVHSIDTAKQNQNIAYHLEMTIDEFQLIIQEKYSQHISQQVLCFDNCKYLMVLFTHDDIIQLIYSNKNVLDKNIIELFKSQNYNNTNEANLFPDYQNETHDILVNRIQGISKKNLNFSVLFEKNEIFDDLLTNLNENIKQTLKKLENYILSADNYLKMILIFIKINSNLPVVIMGETGCGKTSLIAYLALNVLNIKLITFNIHAGVSQTLFLKKIKEILKLKKNLKEDLWLFFDEFNTSDCMYLITEMICNKTLLGKKLPSDLKLLAACNPYKLRNKTLEIGLVLERKSSRLVHIVHPLPDSLLEHIWDYGSLKPNDEKAYIRGMISTLNFPNFIDKVVDLLFMSHEFIRKLDVNNGSVSLRDIDRFRIFYNWFKKIQINRKSYYQTPIIECICLSMLICYYIRISMKNHRDTYIENMSKILKISKERILQIYTNEQNEYLNRMNIPKGIAKNNALRENVFATFTCVMNKIPVYICGKPGCSKTLTIQLMLSNLRGLESKDDWFKTLPGLFAVTYQGSESSTSEGILLVFEKAKKIVIAHQNVNNNENNQIIPLIVFDEMGLAEISKNNPLKVLHSLLEGNNLEMAFVGISNWRLDASKMNRGVFVARSDLTLDDLENTARVILESYIIDVNNYIDYKDEYKFIECLAQSYHNYKQQLNKTAYPEFHGTRDFYYLIKQVSEKLTQKKYYSINEILSIIQISLERNFQGLEKNVCSMKEEFYDCLERNGIYPYNVINNFNSLDLIQKNLEENSRYLMLITRNDSALFILDNFLNKHRIQNRAIFIGSKFENDLNKEEYSFRKLSDIIMYMETGWTIIMQDMDDIYGSLYDLFNQNFTIVGGNKKNCRIALGSVINPMCLVNDKFHCIIMLHEDQLSKCEPPFLNRFEKYFLSFDSIINKQQAELIETLNKWLKSLTKLTDPKIKIKYDNVVINFNDETIPSLVLFYSNKATELNINNQIEFIETNAKNSLIKTMSNFSLLVASQSEMQFLDENQVKNFYELYNEIFSKSANLNDYLNNKLLETTNNNTGFKSIIYTFDNIAKDLKLNSQAYDEMKIGVYKTEHSVNKDIRNFFASQEKNILIVRLELIDHSKHLKLLKFLIEKLEFDYKKTNQIKKSVCLIIHIDFFSNDDLLKTLNKYKMSFLSEWEHIMIDCLNDKFLLLKDLIQENSQDIMKNENVVKFEDIFHDLVTNALNKFDYIDDIDELKENRIYTYRKTLMIIISDNNNEIRLALIEWFKKNIWYSSNIKGYLNKDWRLEIISNEDLLMITYDVKKLILDWIVDRLMFPFVEQFYSIEKYFTFESIFRKNKTSSEIFIRHLNILENKPLNNNCLLNANQANQINAFFNLNIPFILKEYEILENLEENNKKFLEINKCQDKKEINEYKYKIIQNFNLKSI